MNSSLRRPIIAGNWKMNLNRGEASTLIEALKPLVLEAKADVVIGVPYTNLETAKHLLSDSNIKLSAQNCHFEAKGAYTGEISTSMLTDIGCEYVILGHSERREYFAETNQTVNKKISAVLASGMIPIFCVGETLEQRETGVTEHVIHTQLIEGLMDMDATSMQKIVIAYEPIWAIGTGKTATATQAAEICEKIRQKIAELYSQDLAQGISVLYGGSMNAQNANELLSEEHIDGGLIGGASLKPADFAQIIASANELY